MDPFPFCLAIGPLGVYLLVLGGIHLLPRPVAIGGARELIALLLALSGFVTVGPLQLFMPERTAVLFGAYVWLLLLTLYGLIGALVALTARPRIVIYNMAPDRARELVPKLALELDEGAVWNADALVMPRLGTRLHLETFGPLRTVTLKSTGSAQNLEGWGELLAALRRACASEAPRRSRRGLRLAAYGLILLGAVAYQGLARPTEVAQGLARMFFPY